MLRSGYQKDAGLPVTTVVNVAIWGHEASVAMNDLVFHEVKILGSLAYADDHPATIEMVASARWKISSLAFSFALSP